MGINKYLGISRVGIKDVREEFTRTSYTGDHKAMNVEAIDNEEV
jgi:hypothetical protein